MATKVGSLIISLALESGAFKSGLNNSEKALRASTKRIEAMGKSMKEVGTKLSLAVSLPLAALAKASIDEARQSADALAQVQVGIKSMGNAAGRTVEQLQGLAKDEMRKSLYDDDEILRKVTSTLLTFGNVSGKTFDDAQQAALDLSAKLGQDLQSSTIQLGKALNDPIKGLTALKRVGVSFTEQQKDQITAMQQAGDLAGAQKVILAELTREFGGAAQAAANADPFVKLSHNFKDLKETIGNILLKVLPPFTDALNKVLDAFNRLSPGAQDMVVKFGLIAAVLGPIVSVIGTLVTAFSGIGGALALVAGEGGLLAGVSSGFAALGAVLAPIAIPLAAIAAVGALIYANWQSVAPVLEETWQGIKDALGPSTLELISAVSDAFKGLWRGPLGDLLRAVWPPLKEFGKIVLEVIGATLIGTIRGAATIIGAAFSAIAVGVRFLTNVFSVEFAGKIAGYVRDLYTGVKTWLLDKLDAVWKWVVDKITWVKDAFFTLYDAVVGHSYIPDMVDGIALHMARLDAVMVNPAKKATERTKQAFKQLGEDIKGIMGDLFPDARELADFREQLSKLDAGIKAGGAGGYSADQLRAGRQRLIEGASPSVIAGSNVPLADRIALIGSPGDSVRDVQAQLDYLSQAANDNAGNIEVANVRIAKSFKDMANETIGRLQDLASAIKGGGFLDILSAVINLGAQLGSIGVFGKSVQTRINATPHASGTTFHSGGLALVGERGPELINLPRGAGVIPNHALGGGRTVVEIVDTTGLFVTRVNGQISQAAPAIANAGAVGGQARVAFANSRRLA